MGLLSTTYITNVQQVTESSDSRALDDNTEALEKLAKATNKLSKSVDRGRVDMTHARYSELTNKSKLFDAIQDFMNDYISVIYITRSSDDFKNILTRLEHYRGVCFSFSGKILFNENICLVIDESEKICNFEFKGELFVVKEPNYVPDTEGSANINEDKYNLLLRKESLLEKYVKAVEELPHLSYKLLFEKYDGSLYEWWKYCDNDNSYKDYYGMNCSFGEFKTANFIWEPKTKVGNSSFWLNLL
jgi:hypothetical protein